MHPRKQASYRVLNALHCFLVAHCDGTRKILVRKRHQTHTVYIIPSKVGLQIAKSSLDQPLPDLVFAPFVRRGGEYIRGGGGHVLPSHIRRLLLLLLRQGHHSAAYSPPPHATARWYSTPHHAITLLLLLLHTIAAAV